VPPVSPVSSLPRARHAAANLPRDASQAHSCRRTVALVSRSPFASFTTVPTPDQPALALLREREQREQRVLGVQPLYPGLAILHILKGISLDRCFERLPGCCGWLHRRHQTPRRFYQPTLELESLLFFCCSRAQLPEIARDPLLDLSIPGVPTLPLATTAPDFRPAQGRSPVNSKLSDNPRLRPHRHNFFSPSRSLTNPFAHTNALRHLPSFLAFRLSHHRH